jgi:ankyrin repeat protein
MNNDIFIGTPPRQFTTNTDKCLLEAVENLAETSTIKDIIYGDNYININSVNAHKETALIMGTKQNRLELVEILVKNKNTSVNSQDLYGDTALHISVRNNYKEISKLLLADWRTDINIKNKNLEQVIHLVCYRGEPELFGLIETYRDLQVTQLDILGYTPFMYAVLKLYNTQKTIYASIINKLLDYGAIVKIPDVLGDIGETWKCFVYHPRYYINSIIYKHHTLINYSFYSGDKNLFEHLVKNHSDRIDYNHGLNIAIENNNPDLVAEILAVIYTLETPKINNGELLDSLFENILEDEDIIKILVFLQQKWNIGIDTTMANIIKHQKLDVLKHYIHNFKLSHSLTIEIIKDFSDGFTYMVYNYPLDKQLVDLDGSNMLHLAIKYYYDKSIIKRLIKMGVDPNRENDYGNTPLHYAFKKLDVDIINILLPVIQLTDMQRIKMIYMQDVIDPDILVSHLKTDWNNICGPGLRDLPIVVYERLLTFIDENLHSNGKQKMLFNLLGSVDAYLELLIKIKNINIRDSHENIDILTLEEFNESNKNSIIQYGRPINGKYRTLSLEALVKTINTSDVENICDICDPFDRSKLYGARAYPTGNYIFIEVLIRILLK